MTYNAENPTPPGQNPVPTYGSGTTAPVNPGKTLGVVGLILGIVGFFIFFLAPIAGLICSILGLNKSKKAGQKNGLALAGIIVSIVALIANIIVTVAIVGAIAAGVGSLTDYVDQCQTNPDGVIEFQGQQIPCSDVLGQN